MSAIPAPKPTTLEVRAVDQAMAPLRGAKVTVYAVPARGARTPRAEGTTDQAGIWRGSVPPEPSTTAYRFDVEVSRGASGLDFPPKDAVATPGQSHTLGFAVCPAGAEEPACRVAQLRMNLRISWEQQRAAWGDAWANSFVYGQAPVNDPEYYIAVDAGIPTTDAPAVLRNWDQLQSVISRIPWPVWPGEAEKIGSYFRRCTLNLPLAISKNGEQLSSKNFRLYSPTWSDYFPREDYEIRRDIALRYLANTVGVMRCVEHKLRNKAREAERSLKMFSTLGLVASGILGGLAGPAGFATVIATEAVTHYQIMTAEPLEQDVAKALPEAAGLTGQGVTAEVALAGILSIVIGIYLSQMDLDPVARAAAEKAVPTVVEAAVTEVFGGGGEAAAAPVVDAALLSSAAAAAVVKLIAAAIRAQGVREVKEFARIMRGFDPDTVEAAMVPFYVWCIRSLGLGALLDAVASESGIEGFDADRDVVAVAEGGAEESGVEVPAEAKDPAAGDMAVRPATDAGSRVAMVAGAGAGLLVLAFATGIMGKA